MAIQAQGHGVTPKKCKATPWEYRNSRKPKNIPTMLFTECYSEPLHSNPLHIPCFASPKHACFGGSPQAWMDASQRSHIWPSAMVWRLSMGHYNYCSGGPLRVWTIIWPHEKQKEFSCPVADQHRPLAATALIATKVSTGTPPSICFDCPFARKYARLPPLKGNLVEGLARIKW